MVSLQAEPAIDHASFADRRKYRDNEPGQPGHTAIPLNSWTRPSTNHRL